MTHQTTYTDYMEYTDEENKEWFLRQGPGALTNLIWRMDKAYELLAKLEGRMDHAEYEATKERGKIQEALAQYLFLCKEVHGVKRENSTTADRVHLISRMTTKTEQEHLDKINVLDRVVTQQQQRINHLEQMIKEIKGKGDAAPPADDPPAAPPADDPQMKMKELQHMIKPGPCADVSIGSTGSST